MKVLGSLVATVLIIMLLNEDCGYYWMVLATLTTMVVVVEGFGDYMQSLPKEHVVQARPTVISVIE